jgi:RIO kinase 2
LSSFYVRFNLTEKGVQDGSETDDDDSGRPSFLSIQKTSGALDKELAASGFTKKEQVEIEKVGQMLVQNLY